MKFTDFPSGAQYVETIYSELHDSKKLVSAKVDALWENARSYADRQRFTDLKETMEQLEYALHEYQLSFKLVRKVADLKSMGILVEDVISALKIVVSDYVILHKGSAVAARVAANALELYF